MIRRLLSMLSEWLLGSAAVDNTIEAADRLRLAVEGLQDEIRKGME